MHTQTKKQVLQQEAYPAIYCPQNLPILGAIPPKQEKTCPRLGQTAMQKFTPIGKAPAEKSVTVHTHKKQ